MWYILGLRSQIMSLTIFEKRCLIERLFLDLSMDKFDHFNFFGPIYDWIFGGISNSVIYELANVKPDHALLDVGGGTGRVAVKFLPTAKRTIIADSALKMILEAQKKGITAVNAIAEKLPFNNKCFDRIIMVDALHHVFDQRQTLDEIWRLLKPGGRLVIEEPDIKNWFVKIIALGEKILLMQSHFLTPREIMAMCSFDDASNVELHSNKGMAWIIIVKNKNEEKRSIDG